MKGGLLDLWRLINQAPEQPDRQQADASSLRRLIRRYYIAQHWPTLLLVIVIGSTGGLTEQIHAAEKSVALREAELALRDVRASIAGTVYFNRFEQGEMVKPEHVLGQVFDRDNWVGKLKLSERQIGHIKVGEPVQVSLAAYPSLRFGYLTGRIGRIIPVVTPRATGDGVFYVEVALDSLPEGIELHPGMTATGYIDAGRTTWLMNLLGW